jgi:hypothetical protein
MTLFEGLKERRERRRDVIGLMDEIHTLKVLLGEARLERDWWQTAAIDAQLEAEQYKNLVRDLKS